MREKNPVELVDFYFAVFKNLFLVLYSRPHLTLVECSVDLDQLCPSDSTTRYVGKSFIL